MAIGTPVKLSQNYDRGKPVFPAGYTAPWVVVIDAAGLDDAADLATPFRPDTGIATTSRHAINHAVYEGNTLVTRAFYDAAATVPVGGKFSVWGRYNPNIIKADGTFDTTVTVTDAWGRLKNKAGNITRTPPYDVTNDASDGTLKRTTVDPNEDVWDILGCNEIRFGTESAHSVTSGSAALAGLEAKGI